MCINLTCQVQNVNTRRRGRPHVIGCLKGWAMTSSFSASCIYGCLHKIAKMIFQRLLFPGTRFPKNTILELLNCVFRMDGTLVHIHKKHLHVYKPFMWSQRWWLWPQTHSKLNWKYSYRYFSKSAVLQKASFDQTYSEHLSPRTLFQELWMLFQAW